MGEQVIERLKLAERIRLEDMTAGARRSVEELGARLGVLKSARPGDFPNGASEAAFLRSQIARARKALGAAEKLIAGESLAVDDEHVMVRVARLGGFRVDGVSLHYGVNLLAADVFDRLATTQGFQQLEADHQVRVIDPR